MKAVTLYQPYASLVAIGAKKFETRSWKTSYRGPLAMHAGISKKYLDLGWQEPFFSALSPLHKFGEDGGMSLMWWLGYVVATCDLVDCIEITPDFIESLTREEICFGDYTLGRYAWDLENVKQLEKPIPTKGKQGLWILPEEIEAIITHE